MRVFHLTLPRFCLLCALLLLSACATRSYQPARDNQAEVDMLRRQKQLQDEQVRALQDQVSDLQRQQGTAPPPTEPQLAHAPQVAAPQPGQAPPTVDSSASFLEAFSQLSAGNHAAAEAGFSRFLSLYPQHRYAPNAKYWLANAQAAQGNLQSAMSNLLQVVIDPQGQDRAPSALALLAKLYRQMDQPEQADEMAAQLRSRYPDSPEAQILLRSQQSQQ